MNTIQRKFTALNIYYVFKSVLAQALYLSVQFNIVIQTTVIGFLIRYFF